MIQESMQQIGEAGALLNPFPGLRPFELHENYLFFGRDGLSLRLIEKLERTRFLAVVGTSGSGKSSLVRAGMLPALLGGMMEEAGSRWRVAIMRPGNDPIGNLARALCSGDALGDRISQEDRELHPPLTEAALRRGSLGLIEAAQQGRLHPDENLLVIADQFEELFRIESSASDAGQGDQTANDNAAFVKLLIEAHSQRKANIYVVLTMRSDYLGDCARFQDLPEAINEGQYLIPRLTREQLRAAITGPIAVGGAQIAPQLVNRLLNDIGDNQDQLPILQHALMRTWDRWLAEQKGQGQGDGATGEKGDGGNQEAPIDLHHYEAIGTMSGALSLHADEAYEEIGRRMNLRGQQIVQRMFKALTEKDQENRGVRRPVTFANLCAVARTDDEEVTKADKDDLKTIIDCFRAEGRSFLMPPIGKTPHEKTLSDEAVIDISHESLIRNWKGSENNKRLREWIDEETQSAHTYRRLYETALLHQNRKEEMLRGVSLKSMLEWQDRQKPTVAWARRYHPKWTETLNPEQEPDQPVVQDSDANKKLLGLALSFLENSHQHEVEQTKKDKQAELERIELEAQRKWAVRLRWLTALLLVFLLAAVWGFMSARSQTLAAIRATDVALYQQKLAEQKTKEAEDSRADANLQKERAESQSKLAEEAKKRAEAEKTEADKQRQLALAAKSEADKQKKVAEGNADLAKQEATAAKEAREQETIARQQAEEALRQVALKNDQLELNGYSTQMNLASNILPTNPERVIEILKDYLSPAGEKKQNLREFYWYYLWNEAHNSKLSDSTDTTTPIPLPYPTIDTDTAGAKEVSPDGNLVAVQLSDSVQIWDTGTGRLIKNFAGYALAQVKDSFSFIGQTAFAPNSATLAVRELKSNTLKLINPRSGDLLPDLEELFLSTAIKFSDDSKLLMVTKYYDLALQSRRIGVWEVETGRRLYLLQEQEIYAFFSPDSKMIVAIESAGDADKIYLKDAQNGSLIKSFEGKANTDPQFSPDGRMMVVPAKEGFRIQDTTSFKTLYSSKPETSFIQFLSQSKILVSSNTKSTQKNKNEDPFPILLQSRQYGLLDINSGRIAILPNYAPEQYYPGRGVTLSPDGETLLYQSGQNLTALDLRTSRPLYEIKNLSSMGKFSPSDKHLLLVTRTEQKDPPKPVSGHVVPKPTDEQLNTPNRPTVVPPPADSSKILNGVLDIRTNAPVFFQENIFSENDTRTFPRAYDSDWGFYFSDGGKKIIQVEGEVSRWDTKTGKSLGSFKLPPSRIQSMAFFPDNQTLFTGQEDGTLTIQSVTGKQSDTHSQTIQGHSQQVLSVAVSPDGGVLASGGVDQVVKLWDGKNLSLRRELVGHQGSVNVVAFADDNQILATGSDDRTVRLWNVQTGQQLRALEINAELRSLAFSPDGTMLVTGDRNGALKLWDVTTGQQKLEALNAHEGAVLSLAFARDGSKFASASEGKASDKSGDRNSKQKDDLTIKLWDLRLQQLAKLEGHRDSITSVSFSKDGNTLASGSLDGTLRLWDLRTRQELAKLDEGYTDYRFSVESSPYPVLSVSFSPDGNKLAYSRWPRKFGVLVAATEKEVKQQSETPSDKLLTNFGQPFVLGRRLRGQPK